LSSAIWSAFKWLKTQEILFVESLDPGLSRFMLMFFGVGALRYQLRTTRQ